MTCLCVAEWVKLKISGQQCEPLQLDQEDRRRIEEIKRELLLRNPLMVKPQTTQKQRHIFCFNPQNTDEKTFFCHFNVWTDVTLQVTGVLQACVLFSLQLQFCCEKLCL